MCTTPAPPSTALVAASIWSGTGEVNTSPGQAASSIPSPTKPACSGSCPFPPPRGVGADDDSPLNVHPQLGMGGSDAGQRVAEDVRRVVDQFLHRRLPDRRLRG